MPKTRTGNDSAPQQTTSRNIEVSQTHTTSKCTSTSLLRTSTSTNTMATSPKVPIPFKNLGKYDGETDPEEFLLKYEKSCKCAGVTTEDSISALPGYLEKRAEDFFEKLSEDDKSSFKNLITKYIDRFGEVRNDITIQMKLQQNYYKPGTKYDDFLDDCNTIASKLKQKLTT